MLLEIQYSESSEKFATVTELLG